MGLTQHQVIPLAATLADGFSDAGGDTAFVLDVQGDSSEDSSDGLQADESDVSTRDATERRDSSDGRTTDPLTIDELLERCPSAAELDALDELLTITFDDDPTSGTLVCHASEDSRDLTQLELRAYQSLIVMQVVTFDEPLPWTDETVFDWFVGAIDGVRFRSDTSHNYCCSPPGTIVKKIQDAWLLTDLWVNPQNGAGVRGLVAVMIHEARHADWGGHTCGNYDNTLVEMGAWAVEYYYLTWLAYHSDPCFFVSEQAGSSYYLETSRGAADSILTTRFCEEPSEPADPPIPVPSCSP